MSNVSRKEYEEFMQSLDGIIDGEEDLIADIPDNWETRVSNVDYSDYDYYAYDEVGNYIPRSMR